MKVVGLDFPFRTPLHALAIDLFRIAIAKIFVILRQCIRKRETVYYHAEGCLFELCPESTTDHGPVQTQEVVSMKVSQKHFARRLWQSQKEIVIHR